MKMIRRSGPMSRVVPQGSPIGFGGTLPRWFMDFDGTTQVGTLATPWVPNGIRYNTEYYTSSDLYSSKFVMSATSSQRSDRTTVTGVQSYYRDIDLTSQTASVAGLPDNGIRRNVTAYFATGVVATCNGVGGAFQPFVAQSNLQRPIVYIGGDAAGLPSFHGIVADIALKDASPIQGREYIAGTATNNTDGFGATLDTGIVFDSDEFFEIEFDWVRTDKDGTNYSTIVGNMSQSSPYLRCNDSGHTQPDDVFMFIGATNIRFIGALQNTAQGQHCHIKITRDPAVDNFLRCTVCEGPVVLSNNGLAGQGVQTFNGVGQRNGGLRFAGELANLNMTFDNLVYQYPMTREAPDDTLLRNTGPTGDAFDGVWTATNWVDIPSNSRLYKMDEGEGTICEDSLHPGDPAYYLNLANSNGWTQL